MNKLRIMKQTNEILSKDVEKRIFKSIKTINRYMVERTCRDPKLREMVIKDILGNEETQVEFLLCSGMYCGYRVTYFNQIHEYSIIPDYSFPN